MKTCYNCEHFYHDGKLPWCKKLNKETNALCPRCENENRYQSVSKDVSKDVPKD